MCKFNHRGHREKLCDLCEILCVLSDFRSFGSPALFFIICVYLRPKSEAPQIRYNQKKKNILIISSVISSRNLLKSLILEK